MTTTDLGFEERLEHVLARAFERSPEERRRFLEQACDDDRSLLAAALNSLARHNELTGDRQPDADAPKATATTLLDRARWSLSAKVSWDSENTPDVVAGRYRIQGRLGKGGMGLIHRAEDTRLGRTVALKFLLLELNEAPEAKARFLREARAASKLDHPNICTVHEIGETSDGRLYMVMACYDGETLKERLNRGPLTVEEATWIVRQIAAGLGKAHRAGIVHRDVKPGNVFLTDDGQVKVLDFGIAKVIGDTALTRAGASVGTPYYMAPEQATGASDLRSDLWALGVILYEMLTGERPFLGPNHSAIIRAVRKDPVPDLIGKRPDTPVVLQQAVERMLAKDPEQRFQSAEELAAALPVFADPSSSGLVITSELATLQRRKASLLPFLAGVLLTSILASGALYWMRQRPVAGIATPVQSAVAMPTAVAVMPFTVRGGSDYDYLREGMVDLLSTKLDGAGDLRAVDSRALLRRLADRPLDDSDLAGSSELARSLDANLLILGNVFEIAGQLRFDATLYRVPRGAGAPEAQPIASASAEGQAVKIFSLIDDLAIQMLTGMDNGSASRMRRLAAMTSDSFPALKAYLEGESAWRAGRFGDATRAFKAAVDADPAFALAWYRLSAAHSWLMDIEGYNDALERAIEHADRLSPDDRRLLEVAVALKNGDAIAAERLCREVLSQRPEDVDAWSALGELEFHLGPVHGRSLLRSRRSWQRVLELEPDDRQAHLHLARIEGYAEEFQALARRNGRLEELLAGSERVSELRWLRAMLPAAEKDRRILRRSLLGTELGNPWLVAGYALSTLEHMQVWASLYEELLAPEEPARAQTFAHRHLGIFALSTGRLADGERHLTTATHPPEQELEHLAFAATLPFLPVSQQLVAQLIARVETWSTRPAADFSLLEPHSGFPVHHRLYVLGLLVARAGDDERASALADRLAAAGEIASFPGLARDLEMGLRAEIARQAGRHEKVLELLAERHSRYSFEMPMVSPLFGQSRERYLKAEALYHLGRYSEALGWYESLSELAVFDLIYLGPSHLRRAEIHQELGRPRLAAEHYRRFVKRWWNSDPELQPQIDDVRQRLGELSAQLSR